MEKKEEERTEHHRRGKGEWFHTKKHIDCHWKAYKSMKRVKVLLRKEIVPTFSIPAT